MSTDLAPRTAGLVFMLWLAIAGVSPATTTFKALASFDKTNGYQPTHTALVQGPDGNLYGTTSSGGANDEGIVFRITPSGTLTPIYSFCSLSKCADGANPYTSLILASNGDLYGTTYYGGASNNGTLFKITTSGTLTTLYSFCSLASCADGSGPEGQLAVDSAGNIYGTANYGGASNLGTVFKFSTAGKLTTLHSFTGGTDGVYPDGGLVAAGGVFYGTAPYGGADNDGTVFEITTAGVETTLHSFIKSDGANPNGWMVATGGDFYGTTGNGGANGDGTVFKMTSAGTVTTLYSFCKLASCADGSGPTAGLMQATDGNLYGVTNNGGANGHGAVYELTLKGVFTTLYSFCSQTSCEDGAGPQGGLMQDTNGDLYGITAYGGSSYDGVVFSISTGLKPFVTLESANGNVGAKVGILGDGFDSASVVKFNGVTATSTLTEAGLLTATVPKGATDGFVTVTTVTTTLTSTQKFIVHNTWSQGKTMPTARFGAFTGVIGTNVYVIGGATNSAYKVTGVNEIYNTATNEWTTGASDPAPRELGASAVVNGILYVIGGTAGGSDPLNSVEAYDPVSNTWTTKAPMPIAMNSMPAVADKDTIYVIGGYDPNTQTFYDTVQSYDIATDTWTTEQPLSIATAWEAVGLLGTTIVAADGQTSKGPTGDSEGYNPTTNQWTALTADATPRWETCFAAINGGLYVAGGANATEVLNVNEAYNATTKKWTTLAAMPDALLIPGSATVGGQLYCFGGTNSNLTSVYNYVQIYQP